MQYYTYDSNGFYSGVVEAEEQPKNSLLFPPPEKQKGLQPWFDGLGWDMVADYSDLKLTEARERAVDALHAIPFIYEGDFSYSAAERNSFDAQYAEALEVLEGKEPGIYLTALMEVYGVSADEMASKVITKRDAYNLAQAQFNAKVQAMRLRIENAKTVKEVPSVVVIQKLRTIVPAK